jgi:outer membrane protein OmpA-like peptidoglycan-associated protein
MDVSAVQLLEGGGFATIREVELDDPQSLRLVAGTGLASRPVVAVIDGARSPLVAMDVTTTLGASFTVKDWLRVGVAAPWHGWLAPEGPRLGRGDVVLFVGVPLGRGLGAHVEQSFGGAGAGPWLGAPSAAFAITRTAHLGAWTFGLEGGARFQQRTDLPGVSWGPRLELGAGARRPVARVGEGTFELGAELRAAAPLLEAPSPAELPAEASLLAALAGPRLRVGATAGMGLTRGLGSPGVRVGLTVDWLAGRPRDADHDRVLDLADRCDADPEDRDRFDDRDGCPDADNDADGLVDAVDTCPLEPETPNGWRDADGCPDERAVVQVRLDTGDPLSLRLGDEVVVVSASFPTGWETDPGRRPVAGPVAEDSVVVPEGTSELVLHALPPPPPALAPTPPVTTDADPVPFALDDDHVPPSAGPHLVELAAWLAAHPEVLVLRIEGHADGPGSSVHNLGLSRRRAEAVVAALVALGVAPERLEAVGSGEVVTETRSVTFVVLAWDERQTVAGADLQVDVDTIDR